MFPEPPLTPLYTVSLSVPLNSFLCGWNRTQRLRDPSGVPAVRCSARSSAECLAHSGHGRKADMVSLCLQLVSLMPAVFGSRLSSHVSSDFAPH